MFLVDMGLGKTLTVISLILKKIQIEEEQGEESEEESDDEDEENGQWQTKGRKDMKDGGEKTQN